MEVVRWKSGDGDGDTEMLMFSRLAHSVRGRDSWRGDEPRILDL